MAPSTESIRLAKKIYKDYFNTKPKLQGKLIQEESFKKLVNDYNSLYESLPLEDRRQRFEELFPDILPTKNKKSTSQRIYGVESLLRGTHDPETWVEGDFAAGMGIEDYAQMGGGGHEVTKQMVKNGYIKWEKPLKGSKFFFEPTLDLEKYETEDSTGKKTLNPAVMGMIQQDRLKKMAGAGGSRPPLMLGGSRPSLRKDPSVKKEVVITPRGTMKETETKVEPKKMGRVGESVETEVKKPQDKTMSTGSKTQTMTESETGATALMTPRTSVSERIKELEEKIANMKAKKLRQTPRSQQELVAAEAELAELKITGGMISPSRYQNVREDEPQSEPKLPVIDEEEKEEVKEAQQEAKDKEAELSAQGDSAGGTFQGTETLPPPQSLPQTPPPQTPQTPPAEVPPPQSLPQDEPSTAVPPTGERGSQPDPSAEEVGTETETSGMDEFNKQKISTVQRTEDELPSKIDLIPKFRLSAENKSREELLGDIDYFFETFPQELSKFPRDYQKYATPKLKRLHKEIVAKLGGGKKQESKIGIVISGDEYIKQKLKEIILEGNINGLTTRELMIKNIEGQSDENKNEGDISSYEVKRATDGKASAQKEPVYKYIPETQPEPVSTKPARLTLGGPKYSRLQTTAREQFLNNPFSKVQPTIKLKYSY